MAKTGDLSSDRVLTMMDHVRELRTRFFIVVAVFLVAASSAYVYRNQIIDILLAPLGGQKLIYLNPAGGFNFIFLVSIYVGLAVAVPLLLHQLYHFVKPLLGKKTRRSSAVILLSSLLLLLAGIAFGYFYAVPGALRFLYDFAGSYIEASLTADSYLSFVVAYTLGLGLIFQLPLLLIMIHWIKPLSPGGLLKSERWVIVLSFIAAAIITPTPDPLNQTIIALPIVLIYQIGVVTILVSVHKVRKAERRAAANRRTITQQQTTTPVQRIPTPAPHQPTPTPQHATIKPAQQPIHRPLRSVDGVLTGPRVTLVTTAPRQTPVRQSRPLTPPTRDNHATHQGAVYLDGVSRVTSS
jgi:sec-independent protein translocase protein TatC